jgi:hypothetical protein
MATYAYDVSNHVAIHYQVLPGLPIPNLVTIVHIV